MKSIKGISLLALLSALIAVFCLGSIAFAETTGTEVELKNLITDCATGGVVDLQGKTYEITNVISIEASKSLTIKNGTIVDKNSASTAVTIKNSGKLTLENVTISGAGVILYNEGELVVNGGKIGRSAVIENDEITQQASFVSIYVARNDLVGKNSVVTLNSGEFNGKIVVENAFFSSVTINGGTFHGDIEEMNTTKNFVVNGGTFDGKFANLELFLARFAGNEKILFTQQAVSLNPITTSGYRWGGSDENALSSIAAVSQSGTTGEEQTQSFWTKYGSLILIVVLIVVMVLLMVIPQRKQKKQAQEMMASLKVGSTITTIGGIVGTVVELNDQTLKIMTGVDGEQRTMELVRQAIHSVAPEDAPVAEVAAEGETEESVDEIK